jgi:hypothetical protein
VMVSAETSVSEMSHTLLCRVEVGIVPRHDDSRGLPVKSPSPGSTAGPRCCDSGARERNGAQCFSIPARGPRNCILSASRLFQKREVVLPLIGPPKAARRRFYGSPTSAHTAW